MRTQDETSGGGAHGSYADLQQYDQKLKPSPRVPRRSLKKEGFVNEAFIRGFVDELEKNGAFGALLGRAATALKGAGGLKGVGKMVGQKVLSTGKTYLKDPNIQMQLAQGAWGKIQDWRQGRQQQQAAYSGQAGVEAKKPVGFKAGLGLGGAV